MTAVASNESSGRRPRVVVVGGSLGGLLAGNMLLRVRRQNI